MACRDTSLHGVEELRHDRPAVQHLGRANSGLGLCVFCLTEPSFTTPPLTHQSSDVEHSILPTTTTTTITTLSIANSHLAAPQNQHRAQSLFSPRIAAHPPKWPPPKSPLRNPSSPSSTPSPPRSRPTMSRTRADIRRRRLYVHSPHHTSYPPSPPPSKYETKQNSTPSPASPPRNPPRAARATPPPQPPPPPRPAPPPRPSPSQSTSAPCATLPWT